MIQYEQEAADHCEEHLKHAIFSRGNVVFPAGDCVEPRATLAVLKSIRSDAIAVVA